MTSSEALGWVILAIIPVIELFYKTEWLLTKFCLVMIFPIIFLSGCYGSYLWLNESISGGLYTVMVAPAFQYLWVISIYNIFVEVEGEKPVNVNYNFQSGLAKHRAFGVISGIGPLSIPPILWYFAT